MGIPSCIADSCAIIPAALMLISMSIRYTKQTTFSMHIFFRKLSDFYFCFKTPFKKDPPDLFSYTWIKKSVLAGFLRRVAPCDIYPSTAVQSCLCFSFTTITSFPSNANPSLQIRSPGIPAAIISASYCFSSI